MLLLEVPKYNRNIVSWTPQADAFIIHDPKLFQEQVLTEYFDTTDKMGSFLRKLYRWGFQKCVLQSTRTSPAYMHKQFMRGRYDLCHDIEFIDKYSQIASATTPSSFPVATAPLKKRKKQNLRSTEILIAKEASAIIQELKRSESQSSQRKYLRREEGKEGTDTMDCHDHSIMNGNTTKNLTMQIKGNAQNLSDVICSVHQDKSSSTGRNQQLEQVVPPIVPYFMILPPQLSACVVPPHFNYSTPHKHANQAEVEELQSQITQLKRQLEVRHCSFFQE
jgi:hypothetical protein